MADTTASVTEVQGNHSDSKIYYKFVPWDNPDNVITFETYSSIDSFFGCYLNPLIFIIGVPANVLSCVVFFRQGSGILPSSSSSPLLLFAIVFFLVYFLCFGRKDRGCRGTSLLTPLMIRWEVCPVEWLVRSPVLLNCQQQKPCHLHNSFHLPEYKYASSVWSGWLMCRR